MVGYEPAISVDAGLITLAKKILNHWSDGVPLR
jgi:hypothetical protein